MQTLDSLNGGRVRSAKRDRSWIIFDVPVIAINALAGLLSIASFGGSLASFHVRLAR
jgi:hypothetical protein